MKLPDQGNAQRFPHRHFGGSPLAKHIPRIAATITAMNTAKSAMLRGASTELPRLTIAIQEISTTHPCQHAGRPQPQP